MHDCASAALPEFRTMPLAFQAPPDCGCTSSRFNSRRATALARKGSPSRISCGASLTLTPKGLPRLSLPRVSLLHNGSIAGAPSGGARRWRSAIKVSGGYDETTGEEGRELVELVERNVGNSRRMEMVRAAAVVAGLVGLQVCMPALAESLGLEVARSGDGTGLVTNLSGFQNGFSEAFLLIFFSEIGDKTFFIAALLATRKSNLAVFTGTFGALAAMTVISVTLGRAFHYLDNLIPDIGTLQLPLDDLAAVVLLVYFGVSTLVDAASMEGSKAEEEKQDAELAIAGVAGDGNVGFQAAATTVASTFALVFVAEWGDKSFFSTIALAAASSPVGVVTGAIAGHGVATVLAVLGGSFLSEYISEKLIAYVGGTLFLVFAATTLVDILK